MKQYTAKPSEVKWWNPQEFANDFLEVGGMHRCLNFIGDIGHIMEESGFEDILLVANAYESSMVSKGTE